MQAVAELSTAFMSWFASASEGVRSEVQATQRHLRIDLRFRRFPMLRGYVEHSCLWVIAMDRDRVYDWLIDLDCLPIGSRDGPIHCGFCKSGQRDFVDHSALWRDHLFEPFGVWVETKLMTASLLEDCDFDIFLMARLRRDEAAKPDHDRFYRRYLAHAAKSAD